MTTQTGVTGPIGIRGHKGGTGAPTLLTSINIWTANNNFKLSQTVPTVVSIDNSTNVSTTAFVKTAISNIAYPFIPMATSNLNMNGVNIMSPSALTIGTEGMDTTLIGNVNILNDLVIGSGLSTVRLCGGDGGNTFDNTTNNDIQSLLGTTPQNQNYNAVIVRTATWSGTLVIPSVKNDYYVYVINNSLYDWFIKPQVGEYIAQGLAGAGITNASSITIRSYQSFGFTQVIDNTLKYNILINEVINGTVGSFQSIRCPIYDAGVSIVVSLGTSVATGVSIGRSGQPINLNGVIRMPNLTFQNFVFRRGNIQSIQNETDTTVFFPNRITTADTASLNYSNGIFTNTSLLNCICQITYTVAFSTFNGGIRNSKISSSFGTSGISQITSNASNTTILNGCSIINILPAGTFRITCFQNSGGDVNLDTDTSIQILVL